MKRNYINFFEIYNFTNIDDRHNSMPAMIMLQSMAFQVEKEFKYVSRFLLTTSTITKIFTISDGINILSYTYLSCL